ncbi:MAG: metal-dependent hydrolase [Planctomycetia bacterium]|nr:metal-dependent hydrolase [Planctomycetia bacterium]
MAGFKTHVTVSSALGVVYGGAALTLYDVPLPTCVMAGGLCGVSGMFPDLDSGPGIPLRESVAFAAAVVPMLLIDRFKRMGMSHESMVLAGGTIYLAIRFGLAWALKHYTVHRGMFHSLPTAVIFSQLAFLLCSSGGLSIRFFEAGAVLIGFLSHLILDEIWSIEWKGVLPGLKSSAGTAFKMWGPSGWSNVLTYLILCATTTVTLNDPIWATTGAEGREAHQIAASLLDQFRR